MTPAKRDNLRALELAIRAEIDRLNSCVYDLKSVLESEDPHDSTVRCAMASIYACDLNDEIEIFRAREAKP
jgi:hypothetical protein